MDIVSPAYWFLLRIQHARRAAPSRVASRLLVGVLLLLNVSGCFSGSKDVDRHLSVLTLNIWNDKGDWPARRSVMIAEMRTLKPDVIFLQEVLKNSELPNQAMQLADSLGYNYYFSSVDSVDRPKRFGNAILTNRPILAEGWHPLLPLNDYRNIGYVSVPWRDASLDLYVLHLHHLPDSAGSRIRSIQIDDALAFIASTSASNDVLLAGDFNAGPDDAAMALLETNFVDVADLQSVVPEAVVPGNRPSTLNQALGHVPRWIDYVFVSKQARLKPTRVERVMDVASAEGVWPSDHFGVFVEFEATEVQ